MRVVGGPSDGINVWIGSNKQHIQLLDPPSSHLNVTAYDYNNHSDAVQSPASYTLYTVRVIRGPRPQKSYRNDETIIDSQHDELRFLAPQDWSDFKAISYQFTK